MLSDTGGVGERWLVGRVDGEAKYFVDLSNGRILSGSQWIGFGSDEEALVHLGAPTYISKDGDGLPEAGIWLWDLMGYMRCLGLSEGRVLFLQVALTETADAD